MTISKPFVQKGGINPDFSASPGEFAHPVHGWPKWEWFSVVAILCVYLAVQVNNIFNTAFFGQDFSFHAFCTDQVHLNPGRWFQLDPTNRPMVYWVGAVCGWFMSGPRLYALAAAIWVSLSAFALFLLYLTMQTFVKSTTIRVAALVFITFLPLTIITSVVYSADTAAFFPFAAFLFSLSRCFSDTRSPRIYAYGGLAGAALCIGLLSKATFMFLPAGVVVLIFVYWRCGRLTLRPMIALAAGCILLPLALAVLLQLKGEQELAGSPPRHAFNWKGTGEMTWRTLLFPRLSDVRIFDAPGYWEERMENGKNVHPLLVENDYTYPALFTLGAFTDVLDYANHGCLDDGAPRPESHQRAAKMAVLSGFGFLLLIAVGLGIALYRLFRAVWERQSNLIGPAIPLVLSTTWFVPIMLTLPFVHNVYAWGYWLPRLVAPAVWGFSLSAYSVLDSLLAHRSRRLHVYVLLVVLVQAAIHIYGVWY